MALFIPRDLERGYLDKMYDDWPQFVDLNGLLLPSHLQLNRRSQPSHLRTGAQQMANNDNKFEVKMDVSHFTPEEITVKTVDNNVIINGKHEEKMDKHGWVSREFTRRYVLPDECDANKVQSSLTSEGILRVEAPKKVQAINGNERVIPINVLNSPQAQQSIGSQPKQ